MTVCSVEDCNKPEHAKGWCGGHLSRWYKTGDVRSGEPLRPRVSDHPKGSPCSVDGCSGRVDSLEVCAAHVRRLKVHGDVLADVPLRKFNPGQPCIALNCRKKARASGYCTGHYQRFKNHGDAMADKPLMVQELRGTGWSAQNGYVYDSLTRRGQHRIVMEEMLGRPLVRGENVHHKNGLRSDNRPENLELWVVYQPAGQRVVDLVAWAEEVLERYSV